MIDYHKMRQYNRIMLGEGGKYIQDCLEHNYIGVNFKRGGFNILSSQ